MTGITHPELHDLVGEEAFRERVLEVSEFTVDTGLETGFAAYREQTGAITLSEVLHPDDEYQEAMRIYEEQLRSLPKEERLARLLELIEGSEEVVDQMPEMALGRLTTDANVELRQDLVIVAHSHPMLHLRNRDPRRFLLPSAKDLINFGENLAANPGLIEGTVATHQKLGGVSLFLWRSRNGTAEQRLQTLEPGANVSDAVLSDLGLNTATVTYNRRTGTIRSGLATLSNLFS